MNWLGRFAQTGRVGMQALIERRIPFLPAERIERLQQLRLRAIIHHAYNTVPFYHQAMDDRNLLPADFRTVEDLAQLPLIDGVTVRENLDSFVSSAVPERSRLALYTSGSQSQIRRMVYWDRTSLLNRLAIAERDRMVVYRLMGFSGARKRLYILPPESLSIILRSYWEENTLLHRDLVPRQMMPIDAPYETVVERINEIRPHIVYSYGSYAEAFFRFLHNHKLEISLPWVWMYGGDMLSPVGRELIENTFNCPVYSAYGAVETGRLGFECERRNGYHLNVDLCAARIVDENGETADPELAGDVVISNLHNKAMVLLNYRLGDRAVMAGTQCPCGRSLPLLERLEGRSSDVLVHQDGRLISAFLLKVICTNELRSTLQEKIIQPSPDRIIWQIVTFSSIDRQTLTGQLTEKTRRLLGDHIQVQVDFIDDVSFSPTGKQNLVVPLSSSSREANS